METPSTNKSFPFGHMVMKSTVTSVMTCFWFHSAFQGLLQTQQAIRFSDGMVNYNSQQILKPLPGLSLMQHKIDRALTPKSLSPRLSPLITACTTSLGDTRLSSPTLSVVQSRWGQYLTSKYSTPLNASSSQNSWAILSIAATSFLKISISNQ